MSGASRTRPVAAAVAAGGLVAAALLTGAAQQPPRVVSPPLVQQPGAPGAVGAGDERAMPTPHFGGARQFLVQPGQTWQHLVEELAPGDEVILAQGFHRAQTVVGLRGRPGRPVFVRSKGPLPAAVLCDGDGLVLRDPRHVVIEDILFMQPERSGIVLERPPSATDAVDADTDIVRCSFQGSSGAGQDAIRLDNVGGVRIDGVRVDGWTGSAVRIRAGRRIVVRGIMAVPAPSTSPDCGVWIDGDSSEVAVSACAFNRTIRTGVRIGTPATSTSDARPSRKVRVDRCIFDSPGTAIEFAGAVDAVASRITVAGPTDAVYSLPEGAIADGISIERSVVAWAPGELRRFSPHPERMPASAVMLRSNLWYSKELPAGWEAIGRPFGTEDADPVATVDPQLDRSTLRPANPAVGGLGAFGMDAPGQDPASPGAH